MRVIVEPGNPFDFDRAELEDLATVIRQASSDMEVDIAIRAEQGYGVTLFEMLHVFLEVSGAVGATWQTGEIVSKIAKWAKKRWAREAQEDQSQAPRPRSIRVYDLDGRARLGKSQSKSQRVKLQIWRKWTPLNVASHLFQIHLLHNLR